VTDHIPERHPHTKAILDVLGSTGLAFGAGKKPDGTGWQDDPGLSVFVPYGVLHPLSGALDGPLGCPDDDLSAVWQVTAVGADQQQCEQVADRARVALLTLPITVPGRFVGRMSIDVLVGAVRDDSDITEEWISRDQFRLTTAPSP
jgi:hypothetical protein